MKHSLLLSLTLSFLFGTACLTDLSAQNRDDAFRDFVRNRTTERENWRAKANAEFATYLNEAWAEFQIRRGKESPLQPVDEQPTYYKGAPQPAPQPARAGLPGLSSWSEAPLRPETVSTPVAAGAGYHEQGGVLSFNFYGQGLSLPFDAGMRLPYVSAKEKEVAEAWKQLSGSNFMPTVEGIRSIVTQNSLNDWAIYMLIKQMTEALYADGRENERVVTQMFLLCQLEYKVRVGASGKDLVLLLPFKEPIYQVSYISDKGEDLFIFSYKSLSTQTPLYTFTRDFSSANRLISLVLDKPLRLGNETTYRSIKMPLWSKIIGEDIEVPVNAAEIEFFYNYPQTDLPVYHHSAVNEETAKILLRNVKYQVLAEQMSNEDAVSYILSLIQNGFEYKTDYEMFGRSKPLFIQESIYYGANNCKDRVLLFSWLVQEILNLPTVMYGYPNHVSCGVSFDGKEYVSCDPTYIGAPVGAVMPRFQDVEPVVIRM